MYTDIGPAVNATGKHRPNSALPHSPVLIVSNLSADLKAAQIS